MMCTRLCTATMLSIALACVAAAVLVPNCQGGEKDPRLSREMVEKVYRYVLEQAEKEYARADDAPPYMKEAYREVVRFARDRCIGRCPHALFAVLLQKGGNGDFALTFSYLELDFDSSGLLIIERDATSGKILLVEKYPLWMIAPEMWEGFKGPHLWRTSSPLPVRIRKGESNQCRKDIAKWAAWKKNPSLDTWPPAPLWISLPSKARRVEIAICDEAGHVSNPVEVHVYEGTGDQTDH